MTSRLDAIKARAEAATGGPWRVQLDGFDYGPWDEVYVDNARGECPCTPCGVSNAEFIAQSRTDVPALVAAVEAVLELHQPYITRSAWQTCNECWNSGTAEIVYPCPTVAAIRTALGEGEQ